MNRLPHAVSALLLLSLAACAARVPVAPARLQPVATAAPDLVFREVWPVRLSTGYTREVPAGSRWIPAGTLPQGTVYRPVGTVFAIEGRNVHEAWLVVQAGALHGFFLPAENHFSVLSPPLSLPTSRGSTP